VSEFPVPDRWPPGGHMALPPTARERALSAIRGALVTGALRPGKIYPAPVLAQQLGVSSSPAREAILTLMQDGIMEPVRNRGFRVSSPTDHDIDEVYQLRMLLEPSGLAMIVRSGGIRAQLAHFRQLAEQIKAAAADGDVYRLVGADRELHLGLLSLTGNRRLVAMVASLRDQTRLYGLRRLVEERKLTDSANEHSAIVDAIVAGDADLVVRLMQRHLYHIKELWPPPGSD
jgi:DNA-binding GntR family transcriptional regulator